eukprot:1157542-Pelagomonas_calceolata.AAC.2
MANHRQFKKTRGIDSAQLLIGVPSGGSGITSSPPFLPRQDVNSLCIECLAGKKLAARVQAAQTAPTTPESAALAFGSDAPSA